MTDMKGLTVEQCKNGTWRIIRVLARNIPTCAEAWQRIDRRDPEHGKWVDTARRIATAFARKANQRRQPCS
jgi:hypothetical protein